MYYQINKESGKLELLFSKSEYLALDESTKSSIKSNFLFSRALGGWVSRAKFPNLYHAEQIAKNLGAENRGKTGETLSFAEQQERKAERAEARADRMEYRAEQAEKRGEALQKPIENMHGDIAFFSQPIVNTSAGRAFGRKREKMFAAWERGFEEFKKSEYYTHCAEVARQTAQNAKPTDKGFCDRRIAEAEKTIRAQNRNIEEYRAKLARIESGEVITTFSGSALSADTVRGWIENAEEIIEQAISKSVYYRDCLDALGGVQFGKENLSKGDLLIISRWKEPVRFVRGGSKNFTYEFTLAHMTYADGTPMQGKAAYSEIERRA